MNDQNEGKRLFELYKDDLFKRQLSNSENFDRSILSLSTAGLGFSLAFIKDIVHLSQARHILLLHFSWYLFTTAIISTIISYITSQIAITRQLQYAEEYYLKENEGFFNKRNLPAKVTSWLNNISGFIFVFAIVLTTAFVSLNAIGGDKMVDKKLSKEVQIREGATVPKMQKIEQAGALKKGATIPGMQPVQQPQGSGQQGGGQGNSGNQSSGNTEKGSSKK